LRHWLEVATHGQFPLAALRQHLVLLFGQFIAMQQTLKLGESLVEVLCGILALDLVVQDTYSPLCSALLIRGEC
jgi:hypothetical protein